MQICYLRRQFIVEIYLEWGQNPELVQFYRHMCICGHVCGQTDIPVFTVVYTWGARNRSHCRDVTFASFQSGSDLPQNGTNPRLFQIRYQYIFAYQISEHFQNKCTEIWSQKVQYLSNLGQIWSHFVAKPEFQEPLTDPWFCRHHINYQDPLCLILVGANVITDTC